MTTASCVVASKSTSVSVKVAGSQKY